MPSFVLSSWRGHRTATLSDPNRTSAGSYWQEELFRHSYAQNGTAAVPWLRFPMLITTGRRRSPSIHRSVAAGFATARSALRRRRRSARRWLRFSASPLPSARSPSRSKQVSRSVPDGLYRQDGSARSNSLWRDSPGDAHCSGSTNRRPIFGTMRSSNRGSQGTKNESAPRHGRILLL